MGRPLAFLLTPGNIADITAASQLLANVQPPRRLIPGEGFSTSERLASKKDFYLVDEGSPQVDQRVSRQHTSVERIPNAFFGI